MELRNGTSNLDLLAYKLFPHTVFIIYATLLRKGSKKVKINILLTLISLIKFYTASEILTLGSV